MKYELDYDKKLNLVDNSGFVKKIFISAIKGIDNDWWIGQPKYNNSRTTLKVPNTFYSKWRKGAILGEGKKCSKYCGVIMETIRNDDPN